MNEFIESKGDIARLVRRLELWTAASQLPSAQTEQIHQLAVALQPSQLGAMVLFTGPSGAGKTMAAQLLAHDLNSTILRVDIDQVVSKYIGETEKNLDAVFSAAEENASILFFDEADSLFGKRSEVKDSHDRYANLEAAYLLQRAQAHRGLVILASNTPAGLLRSIEHVIEIPTSNYPCD